MIGFVNVSVSKGQTTLLPQLSWSLEPGETLALVGPSGSGKTLALELLLGMKKPTVGKVDVDGVSLSILPAPVLQLYRQRLGIGFQEPRLLSHLTVLENVMLPLQLRGQNDRSASEEARAMLQRMGIDLLAEATPEMLTPGERKMISLARALIGEPSIIVLDEPFDQLDAAQQATALRVLSETRNPPRSLLLLTRDRALAQELSAHIVPIGQMEMSSAPAPMRSQSILSSTVPPPPMDDGSGSKVKITSIGS